MIEIEDWGLIPYKESCLKQKLYVDEIQKGIRKSTLVLCSHPSVITIGRSGTQNNVLMTEKLLASLGVELYETDRGGDVTLHNPGQLVGYTIFDLREFKTDLHWFLREIEDSIIELLKFYDIQSSILDGLTGVWIDSKRKICAIGLHCSRWITSHGFALNVNNNLKEFEYIIPCGISDKQVTSIQMEVGNQIDFKILEHRCTEIFERRF